MKRNLLAEAFGHVCAIPRELRQRTLEWYGHRYIRDTNENGRGEVTRVTFDGKPMMKMGPIKHYTQDELNDLAKLSPEATHELFVHISTGPLAGSYALGLDDDTPRVEPIDMVVCYGQSNNESPGADYVDAAYVEEMQDRLNAEMAKWPEPALMRVERTEVDGYYMESDVPYYSVEQMVAFRDEGIREALDKLKGEE